MKQTPGLLRYTAVLLLICLASFSGQAQSKKNPSENTLFASQWGIGLNVSTFGIGGEVIKGFGPKIDVRAGYSTLNLKVNQNMDIQGSSLALKGRLYTGGAHVKFNYNLADWFHLTLGAATNRTSLSIAAGANGALPYEDVQVKPEDVGNLEILLYPSWNISPYAGIGFGHTLSRSKKLGFSVELGTFYHATPRAILIGNGMLTPTASEKNIMVIGKMIAPYTWWPVLNIELSYRIL
ncbi:MAG: hypothetical protein WC699_18310 [Bacteroidales bacterium]|jgi:hypothetical protein